MKTKLLLFTFSGFTTACLLYYIFGAWTWENYWKITSISMEILLIPMLMNAALRRSAK